MIIELLTYNYLDYIGAGGYTECVLSVNPGDYLNILVGGGGQSASGNGPNGPGGWPDGGTGTITIV